MKTLLAIFIGALSLTAAAQGTYKCDDNFRAFERKYLSKEYNEAYALLSELRKKCPKHTEQLYVYGEGLLKYNIEMALSADQRLALTKDLIALYGEHHANYPKSGSDVKKTLLQYNNKLITPAETYKAFNESFTNNKAAFTDYNALYAYFQLFFDEYKAGKVSDDTYFERFAEINGQITTAQNKLATEKDALVRKQEEGTIDDGDKQFIEDAVSLMDALENVREFSTRESNSYVTCEKMEAYYGKTYEAHKDDLVWLEGVAGALYSKKCYKSDVLLKSAKAIYEKTPTKEAAYRLGFVNLAGGKKEEAISYLDKAASMETNLLKKADIYYEIASATKNKEKATAKKYALQATDVNPKHAKSYLLLAELYSSILPNDECGLTDFDRKALNYLSIEMAKKAMAAESRYKSAASASIKRYEKKLPNKAEAKVLGKKNGDTVTFGCWINETVTLTNL